MGWLDWMGAAGKTPAPPVARPLIRRRVPPWGPASFFSNLRRDFTAQSARQWKSPPRKTVQGEAAISRRPRGLSERRFRPVAAESVRNRGKQHPVRIVIDRP